MTARASNGTFVACQPQASVGDTPVASCRAATHAGARAGLSLAFCPHRSWPLLHQSLHEGQENFPPPSHKLACTNRRLHCCGRSFVNTLIEGCQWLSRDGAPSVEHWPPAPTARDSGAAMHARPERHAKPASAPVSVASTREWAETSSLSTAALGSVRPASLLACRTPHSVQPFCAQLARTFLP